MNKSTDPYALSESEESSRADATSCKNFRFGKAASTKKLLMTPTTQLKCSVPMNFGNINIADDSSL